MKWLKTLALILLVLIGVMAVVPFFITLNDYIPVVEKEISARIGEPVSIDSLHVAAFPVPHARIDGITIGGAEDIKLGKVTFTPDVWSLMRSQKVIRSVELEDLTLTSGALGALAALTQRDRSAANIRVDKIRLENAVVKLDQSKFGPFDVTVTVSSAAQAGHLVLTTRDGALKADLTPEDERYRLDISARGWTPPIGPAVRFDELSVKGVVRSKDADLSAVDAKLYGGSVSGKATLAWEKGITVTGAFDVKHVELQQASALVSPKTHLSGKLDAKPVFSAHAATTAQLDDTLRLETPFTVHNGVLHGFDLLTAATTLGKSTGGGETRFTELAGQLLMDRRDYRFSDLRITSGPLAARGTVAISPSRALSGQLNTNVKGFGRIVAIPLTVAGTLDSPKLYPDPAALAAAAAGTAVLGPGLGTAAGAKLGEVVEGLFGNSRKR